MELDLSPVFSFQSLGLSLPQFKAQIECIALLLWLWPAKRSGKLKRVLGDIFHTQNRQNTRGPLAVDHSEKNIVVPPLIPLPGTNAVQAGDYVSYAVTVKHSPQSTEVARDVQVSLSAFSMQSSDNNESLDRSVMSVCRPCQYTLAGRNNARYSLHCCNLMEIFAHAKRKIFQAFFFLFKTSELSFLTPFGRQFPFEKLLRFVFSFFQLGFKFDRVQSSVAAGSARFGISSGSMTNTDQTSLEQGTVSAPVIQAFLD